MKKGLPPQERAKRMKAQARIEQEEKPQELYQAKCEAHRWFDVLWQDKHMSRNAAYRWLSRQLKLKTWDCHISSFDIRACNKTVKLVERQIQEMIRKELELQRITQAIDRAKARLEVRQ